MKKVFKKVLIIIVITVMALFITACSRNDNNDPKTPTLAFEKLEVELMVGETYTLNPSITELSGNDLVNYRIDNERIISISGTTVSALMEGSTIVHASLKGYDDIKADITFTVISKQIEREIAKLDEKYQGKYSANGIEVNVEESKITVNEGSNVLEFTLYTEDGRYYILDNVGDVDVKVFISFTSDGKTITAEGKGEFLKEEVLKEGEIPTRYRGTFFADGENIETAKNTLKIINLLTAETKSYNVYTDDTNLFIIVGENREYFTFDNNVLTIFSKRYPKSEGIVLDDFAKLSEDQIGEYTTSDKKKVILSESTIIYGAETSASEIKLYQDDNGVYYFLVVNESPAKIYISFATNSVTINGNVYYKEGADLPASIDASKQGTYYNNKGNARVFSDTIILLDASGSTNKYDLFKNEQGIYFVDTDNSIQFINIDDYSITVKNQTYYKEYTSDESVRGFYMNEEQTLSVREKELYVFITNTEKETYKLLIDQSGIFFFDKTGAKQSVKFTDTGLICVYGTFVKQSALNEHSANLSEDLQGEYTGNGMRYVVYADSLYIYTDGSDVYSYKRLVENAIGIYYLDGSSSANIYCKFEDGKLINKFGTFEQTYVDKKTTIDAKYAGVYISDNLTIILDEDTLEYHKQSVNEEADIYKNKNNELYVTLRYDKIYKLSLFDDKIELDCEELNQHLELTKMPEAVVDDVLGLIPNNYQRAYRYYQRTYTFRYNTVELVSFGSTVNQYILSEDGNLRFYHPEYRKYVYIVLLDNGNVKIDNNEFMPVINYDNYEIASIDETRQGEYIYSDDFTREKISLDFKQNKVNMFDGEKLQIIDLYNSYVDSNIFFGKLETDKYDYALNFSFDSDNNVTVYGNNYASKKFTRGSALDLFDGLPVTIDPKYEGYYLAEDGLLYVEDDRFNDEYSYDVYKIYRDNEGLYCYDEASDFKIYFSFIDENTLETNIGNYKRIEEDRTKIARLNSGLGKYYYLSVELTVEASKVILNDIQLNETYEYVIYNFDGRYFIFEDGAPAELKFDDDNTLKIDKTLFINTPTAYINVSWPSDLIASFTGDIEVPNFTSKSATFNVYTSEDLMMIDCFNATRDEYNNYVRALIASGFREDFASYVQFDNNCGLFIEVDSESNSIHIGTLEYEGEYNKWPREDIIENYYVNLPEIDAKAFNLGTYNFEIIGASLENYTNYANELIEFGFIYYKDKDKYLYDNTYLCMKVYVTIGDYNATYHRFMLTFDFEEYYTRKTINEEFLGQYLSDDSAIIIDPDYIYYYSGSYIEELYIYGNSNYYFAFFDNDIESDKNILCFNIDDSLDFAGKHYVRGNVNERYSNMYSRLSPDREGFYLTNKGYAQIGRNNFSTHVEGKYNGGNINAEYDGGMKYFYKEYNYSTSSYDKTYLVFGNNSFTYKELEYSQMLVDDTHIASFPEDYQGQWYFNNSIFDFSDAFFAITDKNSKVTTYALYYTGGEYYFEINGQFGLIDLIDGAIYYRTHLHNNPYALSREATFVSNVSEFPSDLLKKVIKLDGDFDFVCADPKATYNGSIIQEQNGISFNLSMDYSTEEDALAYANKLIDLGFIKTTDKFYVNCDEEVWYRIEFNDYWYIVYSAFPYISFENIGVDWQEDVVGEMIPEPNAKKYLFQMDDKYCGEFTAYGISSDGVDAYKQSLIDAGFTYNEAEARYRKDLVDIHKNVYVQIVNVNTRDAQLRIVLGYDDIPRDYLNELGETFTIRYKDGFSYNKIVSRQNDEIIIETYSGEQLSQVIRFVKASTNASGKNMYYQFLWYQGYGWQYSSLVDEDLIINNLSAPLLGDQYLLYNPYELLGQEEVNGVACDHYQFALYDTVEEVWVGAIDRYIYKISRTENEVTRIQEELYEIDSTNFGASNTASATILFSSWNNDAIVNIFGADALAEFGEGNTKYFYTDQYIYAFNVSEDYFNTYKREHCGDNSSFNICLFGRLFVLNLSYEVLSNSNIGLMTIVVSKSNSIFPDEYTISKYGDIFPTYTGNGYFETSIAGTEYLLYDATISDVELYQGLLSQNGWVYDEQTTAYKHTFNEGFVYLYMLTVTSTFRFVLQTE